MDAASADQISTRKGGLRLKVAHVTMGGGGLDVYIKNIIGFTDPARFSHLVIGNKENGSLESWCLQKGVAYRHVEIAREIDPLKDLCAAWRICVLLSHEKPDLIHLHSSKAGVLGRLVWPHKRHRVIYTPNACAYLGETGFRRVFFLGIESILAPLTGLLLASTPSEMQALGKDLWFKPARLSFFYNSLDLEEIDRENIDSTDAHDGRRVVCAARLINQKNPLMLVRVAERVCQVDPSISFHILGAGYQDFLGEELNREITRRGLAGKVHIHPWMSKRDALQFVGTSSIAISTAIYESFGFFVAEAQAMRKPVVATEVQGIVDVVDRDRSGFLVAVDDDAAMADKILALSRNRELRERLGNAGLAYVRDKLDIRRNVCEIEAVYCQQARATGGSDTR